MLWTASPSIHLLTPLTPPQCAGDAPQELPVVLFFSDAQISRTGPKSLLRTICCSSGPGSWSLGSAASPVQPRACGHLPASPGEWG